MSTLSSTEVPWGLSIGGLRASETNGYIWMTGEEKGERTGVSGKMEGSFLPPSHDPLRALFFLSPSCEANFIEDELHLFYICPLYNELRADYFSKLNITNEALSSSTSMEKILTICTVVNQALLDEYIFKCNRKRKEMLNL